MATEPKRHPSTRIPTPLVEEINFRAYLLGLEPPMTPEQSTITVYTREDNNRKIWVQNDASRRHNAQAHLRITRAYLKAMTDMGLLFHLIPKE